MGIVQSMIPDTKADPRWARIVARDKRADGDFWYSVATTGIYCRPSCPSRMANPRNVGLHDTLAEAKATGFRACKRCDPDGVSAQAAIIVKACRLIEHGDEPPSLEQLAAAVALSPGYLQRLFKRSTGLSPKAYAAALRAGRLRLALDQGCTVTEAIYDAGFTSSGRFYAQAANILGMRPTAYKAGGANEDIRFAIGQSSLGAILVASSAAGLVAILLGDDPNRLAENLQDRFPKARLIGGDTAYENHVAQVIGLIETPGLGLGLPMDVRGTAFQQRVWQALQNIPPGQTLSYTELAQKIGAPKAVRAVAQACASNPLAIAIPCHRVVRTDGALSGYAWGVDRKRALIARERSHARGAGCDSC